MHPRPDPLTLEAQLSKKTKSSCFSPDHCTNHAAIHFHLLCRPRARIILTVLSLQLLILLSSRSIPPSFTYPLSITIAGKGVCDSGMVYVYDVPPVFNKNLIDNCSDLNPWHSLCDAVSNNGFGQKATGLNEVIPNNFLSFWYATDQFTTELIYHQRVLSHRCRTLDPSSASALYIPFYAGLAVGKHLWDNNATIYDRDRQCTELLRWVQVQEAWKKSGGRDHFIALGRITWDFRRSRDSDWGSSFLHMPAMKHVTRLVIERSPWDERDVGIPYPTGFHPHTAADVRAWQKFVLNRTRPTLVSFVGSSRPGFTDDFRTLLLDECKSLRGACQALDCGGIARCGNRSSEALSLFLDSVFCLQPRGDSFTRRSMFDCMVAGAVPVLFWRRSAYEQYEWYLPLGDGKEGEWSVFIDSRKVRRGVVSVRRVLEGIGEERATRMRERVVEMIPRLVYAGAREGLGEGMEDAFDVALDGVLRRFRNRRAA